MTRILVAVNDSPAGVAAARAAIRYATETDSPVRAIHVLPDGAGAPAHPGAPPGPGTDARRARGSAAVLAHIADLAERAGVQIEALTLTGRPARVILEQAALWQADLIVIGRSGVRHVGQPFVGSQVLNVLEFAEVPVLVVPAP